MEPTIQLSSSLPGAPPLPHDLLSSFEAAREKKGRDYQPRTRHLISPGKARYTNRLILESSPYLQQHAHNPVNWYPWGEEAFNKAKALNRPVFVSIGYSTCHWCHVMEEESFESEEIAHYLNTNYVAIKVDREERPDIDAVYMAAVQAISGNGGWPMSIWLTPDQKPFWGGTYFPARDGDRGAAVGFLTILRRLNRLFKESPDKIEASGQQLTEHIRSEFEPVAGQAKTGAGYIHSAIDYYLHQFDSRNGGLSRAPKFPSTLPIGLLLRVYRRTGNKQLLSMVSLTLEKMANGGIYDQVAGGFHRYATDVEWLVPHFEKMLYDNALLAVTYLEAFQVTGNPRFKTIVEEILHYVQREMISPESLFYSATDADSLTPSGNREEGYYFTWTPDELDKVLDPDERELVKAYFNVTNTGNFEGRNILHIQDAIDSVAKRFGITEEETEERIEKAKQKLYEARNQRNQPICDDKILTAWNGLMISAFAKAGFVFDNPVYLKIAETTAQAVFEKLCDRDKLLRTFKDGRAKYTGFLTDYAFFISALLDLHQSSLESQWLEKAIALDKELEDEFEDKERGGFYTTASSSEKLIAREKPYHDGALPSGNAVALMNLLRLATLTGNLSYQKRFQKSLNLFLKNPRSNPVAQAEMLKALDFSLDKPKEIVLVIPENQKKEGESFLSILRTQFQPNAVIVVLRDEKKTDVLAEVVPMVREKAAIDGKVTAYVCEKGNCRLPLTSLEDFKETLATVQAYSN